MSKTLLAVAFVVAAIAAPELIPGLLGVAAGSLAAIAVTAAVEVGLSLAANQLIGPTTPKGLGQATNNQMQRLFVTMDTTAPRKIVLGSTAGATDLRYQSYTGTNQRYYEQVIAVASHQVNAISEIWLDNEKAWTAAGGVQGRFVGFLTVDARAVGTSSSGIAIDSTWTTSCTLTGCAYVHLKFDLLGSSSTTNNSPFASGVTSRVTIRTQGALVYDPRLDSTVAGGSGPQRAATQSTWAWDSNASANPALQLLFYLLGWQINGKLAVGMGMPSSRIDLASFAVAANACDASITLNGGGTEPRYRSAGVITEGDDRQSVIESLCATMNAVLRDAGGKISLTVLSNDLASPVASFTEADILGEERWDQTPDLSSTFNICRGRRVDPSDTALYQLVDVPEASLASNDGIDRIDTMDMPFVSSNGQAQRLLKQRLQRKQYQGKYTFTGNARWWQTSLGNVVQMSHAGLGWVNKLFRVAGQTISRDGTTKMTLIEENAAIYAWSNNESAAVAPGAPTIYDPLNSPLQKAATSAAGTADWPGVTSRPIELTDGRIPLAVDSGGQVLSGAIGDGNRVRFSRMEGGTAGYDIYDATASSIAPLDTGASSGKTYVHTSGNFTANAQECSIGTIGPTVAGYRIPVTAGERLWVAAQVGSAMPNSACTCALLIIFFDATNTSLGSATLFTGNGSDSFPTLRGNFATVPAGTVWAQMRYHATNNSLGITGAFNLYVGEWMVCTAGAHQTVAPSFQPGPSGEFAATVGAIAGPGGNLGGAVDPNLRPLVDFSQAGHLSKNLDNIGDGSTYGRPIITRLNGGKPLIDFAEPIHLNQTQDNMPDGTTYVRIPGVNTAGGGTSRRALVDFTQSHLNKLTSVFSDDAKLGVTAVVIDPIGDVVIHANSSGTIKSGELPRNVAVTASVGTSAVTTAGAWSRTATTGVTCTIGAATGVLNITAMSVAEAYIPVSFVYNGITRTGSVHVVVQNDPPSTSGGGGGGGGSGSVASTSDLGNTTGTAYDTTNAVSGVLSVVAGAAGSVTCSAPISYKRASSSAGQTGAAGKWQWRIAGGTFADITTETVDTTDYAETLTGGFNVSGSLSVSATKTGLTNGSTYEFRFLWREVVVAGTASRLYSVSGSMTATVN